MQPVGRAQLRYSAWPPGYPPGQMRIPEQARLFREFQIGFQQPKYSLGIQCVHTRRSQADYKAFLPVNQAARFHNESFNAAEVVLETHNRLTNIAAAGSACCRGGTVLRCAKTRSDYSARCSSPIGTRGLTRIRPSFPTLVSCSPSKRTRTGQNNAHLSVLAGL